MKRAALFLPVLVVGVLFGPLGAAALLGVPGGLFIALSGFRD